MGRTGRVFVGVLAGAALWAVLWVGGTAGARAAFPELLDPTRRLEHVGALLALTGYSVVLSILAGYVAATLAGAATAAAGMRAAWLLAWLQLAIGLVVEISSWELLPVWYHVLFLALIVPATVYGGRLRTRRRATAP
ncbi:MAG: hypothetical protein ACODAB_10495 [Gemmatimonadota bacterium]